MNDCQCSIERFTNDIKDHKLTIIKNDGLYRHLRFSRPESRNYCFDILTWPGHLCITGDMGSWLFSRIEDMFDFFIMRDGDFNKKHVINPSYWEEKILSSAKFGGPAKEFNAEIFKENVIDIISSYFEDEEEKKTECLEEIGNDVLCYLDDEHPQIIYQKLHEFRFDDFYFDEMPHCETYTFHYIWICYAIVYGITEFNKMIGDAI